MKKILIIVSLFVLVYSYSYFKPIIYYNNKDNKIQLNHLTQYVDNLRPTIIVAMPPAEWLGEPEVTARLMLTAKSMGWNVLSENQIKDIRLDQLKNVFGIYVKNYVTNYNSYLLYNKLPKNIPLFEIDFVVDKKAFLDPIAYFYNKNRPKQVKAILGTSLNSIDLFTKEHNTNLKFTMTWYPTVQQTDYRPNFKPEKLVYCGGTKYSGDQRLSSKKYLELWNKLDKTRYFVVYGNKYGWKGIKNYKGYIPPNGKSFVETINAHGVCLVLHSNLHLNAGAPSGRIFEAAAAAAVIISDKHPFVMQEFKDSVLYIDHTREDLFEQIDAHMSWIKNNPDLAKKKALQASKIFLEKFTLEKQLSKLYKNFQATR